jgi:hypothetical protein
MLYIWLASLSLALGSPDVVRNSSFTSRIIIPAWAKVSNDLLRSTIIRVIVLRKS